MTPSTRSDVVDWSGGRQEWRVERIRARLLRVAVAFSLEDCAASDGQPYCGMVSGVSGASYSRAHGDRRDYSGGAYRPWREGGWYGGGR